MGTSNSCVGLRYQACPIHYTVTGKGDISASLSLFSYRKFSELQFMLRPVNSRKNPNFCHLKMRKLGDINKIQIPGQTTAIFLIHSWSHRVSVVKLFILQWFPLLLHLWFATGKGKGKRRGEATRNYCSSLALARICKPPLSR